MIDEGNLPEHFTKWYDSLSGEIIYFENPGTEYVRVLVDFIIDFLGDHRAADIIIHLKSRFNNE
jgi:hypothetical protein